MVHSETALSFAPLDWDETTEKHLSEIAATTERDVAIFRDAVGAGTFCHWAILDGGERVGSLIWSVAHEPDGFVYVINAAAVDRPTSRDVTAFLFDWFEGFAKQTGAIGLRCWTERAGLMRKLVPHGRLKYVLETYYEQQQ